MKHKFFTLILLISNSLFAQETVKEFSLNQAVQYGLQNNNEFKNTILDAEILKESAFEIMTEGFPKISASLDYNYAFEQQVSIVPAGVFGPDPQEFIFAQPHAATLSGELQQLIFDSRYIFGLKARKAFLQMADLQVELGRTNAKDAISKSYYNALVAQQSFEQLQGNKEILEQLLYETLETYKAGLTDELSVNRLELNLSNLNTQIEKSRTMAQNALMNLKFTIGMPDEEQLILTDNLDSKLAELNYELDAKLDLSERTENSILNLQDEIRLYDIKQARSNYFPSVYGFANYGTLAQRQQFDFFNDGQWFDFGTVGFNINVPIFDGLKARSQVQQRKLEKEKNLNELKNFKESANLQVEVARNNLINALNEYNTQLQNVELAEKILNKTIVMFNEGVGSSFELSTAQQELTNTQINFSQAIYNLLVAELDMKKALGNL